MALQQLLRLATENDDYDLFYVLLINEQIPRCVSYDRAWPRFNIDTLTDDQCSINFRFVKRDIVTRRTVGTAGRGTCNGCVCPRIDALCRVFHSLQLRGHIAPAGRLGD